MSPSVASDSGLSLVHGFAREAPYFFAKHPYKCCRCNQLRMTVISAMDVPQRQ